MTKKEKEQEREKLIAHVWAQMPDATIEEATAAADEIAAVLKKFFAKNKRPVGDPFKLDVKTLREVNHVF